MPQMSPMNWLALFIIFFMIFILFNMMNYFMFFYKQKMLTPNLKNYNLKLPFSWKW